MKLRKHGDTSDIIRVAMRLKSTADDLASTMVSAQGFFYGQQMQMVLNLSTRMRDMASRLEGAAENYQTIGHNDAVYPAGTPIHGPDPDDPRAVDMAAIEAGRNSDGSHLDVMQLSRKSLMKAGFLTIDQIYDQVPLEEK